MPRSRRPGAPRWQTESAEARRETWRPRPSSIGSRPAASDPSMPEHLAVSVRAANWDLRAHVERDPALSGMATTFTGLLTSRDGALLLAHTGDSRAYRLRAGVLDAADARRLVRAGSGGPRAGGGGGCGIPPPSQPHHVIAQRRRRRCRGGRSSTTARHGDRWLLCSDGLTDYVPDAEIAALLMATARRRCGSPRVRVARTGCRDARQRHGGDLRRDRRQHRASDHGRHSADRHRATSPCSTARPRSVQRGARDRLSARSPGARARASAGDRLTTTMTSGSNVRGSGPSSFSTGWPSRTQYS